MSKIAIKSSSSGTATFTIESPATNTDRTLVLPDVAGTVVLDTTLPPAPAAVVNTFNSSGTWTKPASGSMARIQVWGGGGGGSRNTSTNLVSGAGGGGYAEITLPLSSLASSVTVTVGASGAGRTGSTGEGTAGGTTTFGALIGASGGAGGSLANDNPLGGVFLKPDLSTAFTRSVAQPFVGGLGALVSTTLTDSLYGGGGGAGAGGFSGGLGGVSYFGGSGGAGSHTANGGAGTAPAGGGGSASNDFNGGNGGAGRVVVTVW